MMIIDEIRVYLMFIYAYIIKVRLINGESFFLVTEKSLCRFSIILEFILGKVPLLKCVLAHSVYSRNVASSEYNLFRSIHYNLKCHALLKFCQRNPRMN